MSTRAAKRQAAREAPKPTPLKLREVKLEPHQAKAVGEGYDRLRALNQQIQQANDAQNRALQAFDVATRRAIKLTTEQEDVSRSLSVTLGALGFEPDRVAEFDAETGTLKVVEMEG